MSRNFSEICPACGYQCMTVEQCHRAQHQKVTQTDQPVDKPLVQELVTLFGEPVNTEKGSAGYWTNFGLSLAIDIARRHERESQQPVDCIEDFRQWAAYYFDGVPMGRDGNGNYWDERIQAAWKAWCASPEREAVQPVEKCDHEKTFHHRYLTNAQLDDIHARMNHEVSREEICKIADLLETRHLLITQRQLEREAVPPEVDDSLPEAYYTAAADRAEYYRKKWMACRKATKREAVNAHTAHILKMVEAIRQIRGEDDYSVNRACLELIAQIEEQGRRGPVHEESIAARAKRQGRVRTPQAQIDDDKRRGSDD